MMKEMLPQVDAVIEILDARIPISSKNPELHKIVGNKPVLTLFSKSTLADPESISRWKRYYEKEGKTCLFIDSASGAGINEIPDKIRGLLSEKLARYENKGMTGKALRVMIAGIPNVGKSSLINRLAGGKRAKVEDRPGVTRDKQWITTKYGIELLDTPGVLWPKFEDQTVGENLAVTGAIRDEILDQERIAVILCSRLRKKYPELLSARYKLGDMSQYEDMIDYDLFETIGRKRGFLISGGEVNTERTAVMLLDEFRGGKIGRMTLEEP
jgi:ribosome biogenesis GTPase A